MPREYEADCASLEIEFFGGHNALRCLHLRRWLPKLRENASLLVKALGFQDCHFIQCHANCDREATIRAKATTRKSCPMNEECKHQGYRNTYPVLDDGRFSRRRKCFRILPSQSRHDITDQIEWEGRFGRHMADWTPLMPTMFAEWKPSRKSKRPLPNEKNTPFRWSKSMRITLDRVELLGVAFAEEPREMALMTELFGYLSVEAASLRCIRDIAKSPRPRRIGFEPREVEPSRTMPPNESEMPATETQLAAGPETHGVHGYPSKRENAKEKPAPAHERVEGEVIVPINTHIGMGTTRNRPEKKTDTANVARAKETAGADDDERDEVSIGETSVIAARPKRMDTENATRSPRFDGDEDWLGEQERLRPPTKRLRTTQFAGPFPYTRGPNSSELATWKESWSRFYQAQEILKRLPGADMSKHRIPIHSSAGREPKGDTAAPALSQSDLCDSREEGESTKRSANKRQRFRSRSDHWSPRQKNGNP